MHVTVERHSPSYLLTVRPVLAAAGTGSRRSVAAVETLVLTLV